MQVRRGNSSSPSRWSSLVSERRRPVGRTVRYCNVCRRWGGLRSTHLCSVNWFENLADLLLAALEKGEAEVRIYLAAPRERALEMAAVATQLRAVGHEVTARWIRDRGGTGRAGASRRNDLADIVFADALVLFTESTCPRESGSPRAATGTWRSGTR